MSSSLRTGKSSPPFVAFAPISLEPSAPISFFIISSILAPIFWLEQGATSRPKTIYESLDWIRKKLEQRAEVINNYIEY